MKGIDVSMHNGTINYESAKNDGVEVVIIKATEGVDYVDPYLEKHYSSAKSAGLNIGFYHFMSEKTDPVRQAEDFYNAIKDKEYNVIPVLDIETNKMGRSAAEITDRCIQFLTRFKELSGIDCMIYTGGYFGRDLLDSRIKSYKAWIAHYGVSTPMNTGFNDVIGHQYTETGRVSGVNGNVDLNNFTEGILLSTRNGGSNSPNNTTGSNPLIRSLQEECNKQGFSNQVVDGIAGSNTINGCPTLKEGARGNITKILQTILGVTADGIFGPNTKAAVVEFQKTNGLSQDGIVGPKTWRKLLGM